MRLLKLFLVSVFIISMAGCASKKFAKQADKYAAAGLFQNAAEMYYRSVAANDKNIDARMGLQRNGQLLLQKKLDDFKTHFDNGSVKDAVYAYIDAEQYYRKVKNVGVELIFPSENKVYFDEVKEQYLGSRYNEALQALDADEFAGAESILSEILKIDPSYKDSKTHWVTAKYEPIYRRGVAELDNQLYRTAYYSFDEIVKGTGTYKDALANKATALENAMITIAMAPFYYPYSTYSTASAELRSQISKELSHINSPFYKTVADPVIATLPANGKRSRITDLIPYISAFSKSIEAKAVLTASLSRYTVSPGKMTITEKKGYLKNTEEYIDKTTGEKKTKVSYGKTLYKEYSQENSVSIIFEYSLIDVKSGIILVSDAFNVTKKDECHYASYQGDVKKLVPGNWKYSDKDSPGDAVSDNQASVNQLKALLSASKEIKSTQAMVEESFSEMSKSLVKSIENYNPEK